MDDSRPLIALDGRLIAGESTGDSTYWTALLGGFAELGLLHKMMVFSDRPRPDSPYVPREVDWHTVPARSSRWWSLVRFPLAVRRAGMALAHVQYSASPLLRRFVTTVHDVSFFIGPEWFRPMDRRLLSRSIPSACRRAAAVITVSETSRGEIERFIPAARGKTYATLLACPPWVVARDKAAAQERVRTRFRFDEPFTLTVGSRWPRKRMELAVEAMDLLPAHVPHRLIITGRAAWGDQSLGQRALTTGYVDAETLSDLYAAADLYLAPSRHEGFGLPVLEAWRTGTAVLAARGGALPEVIGPAGVLAAEDTPLAWAGAIEELLTDSSKLRAAAERGAAREREFTWRRTATETWAIYQRILGS
jgi:glycosyltransferase involved in cell wall biosynthesis